MVGYAGIALAALLSVSYAGLDITNLAIVAGALSVGIGFGLQSIVNNFVSGLILLIERPIKVGDRIVIGDQQGLVRRISVRATEIETFDRASLIVPNSELITGRVLNWTHRDSLGAVNVKIGVGYDSDPEQVIAILKKCAEDHPEVLRTPAPGATFEGFGDSALLFNSARLAARHRQGRRRAVGLAHCHLQGAGRGRHRDSLQPGRCQPARPGSDQGATWRMCLEGIPTARAGQVHSHACRRRQAIVHRRVGVRVGSCNRRQPDRSSSRKTFSRRSWRSCASSESVAMGRASRRFNPIGSPVSSQ